MAEARNPKQRRWDKVRYGGLGLLVGLVIGALAAGYVYVEGRERLASLDATRAKQALQVGEDVNRLRDQLLASRSMDALLRARIAAGQALDELDRANFGLSREHVRSVGLALAEVDPRLVNIDPDALAATRRLVDGMLTEVPLDVATQRDRLQEMVRSVDALIPREPLG